MNGARAKGWVNAWLLPRTHDADPRASRLYAAAVCAFAGVLHLGLAFVWRHPLDPSPRPLDLALPLLLGALAAATRSTGPAVLVFALIWCPELASTLRISRWWGALGVLLTVALFHRPAPIVVAALTALLAFRPGDHGSPTKPVEGKHPNILLITVDTVRADAALLDRLQPTRRYSEAIAPAPWTLPSMQALFTGRPARETAQGMPVAGGWGARTLPSLVERFQAAGYDTRAWVSNPHITAEFASGFNHFWHSDEAHALLPTTVWDSVRRRWTGQLEEIRHSRDQRLEDAALAAMRRSATTPRFYWVHLLGPHEYTRDPQRGGAPGSAVAYAGNVADAGDRVSRLLQPGWIVAVTSDHGEAFGEGGVTGHGHLLQDAELRVPLAFFGVDPGDVRGQVGTVALLPTLGRLAGVDMPSAELAQERVAVGPGRRRPTLAFRVGGGYQSDEATPVPGARIQLDQDKLEALGYLE